MQKATVQRLGTVLLEKGFLTAENLETALAVQHDKGVHGKLLGEILVEQQFCTEEQVLECVAEVYGVPYARLDERLCDP